MPSFLERISAATRSFFSPQQRGVAPLDVSYYQGAWGMPSRDDPIPPETSHTRGPEDDLLRQAW